jgi:hypothetical protein
MSKAKVFKRYVINGDDYHTIANPSKSGTCLGCVFWEPPTAPKRGVCSNPLKDECLEIFEQDTYKIGVIWAKGSEPEKVAEPTNSVYFAVLEAACRDRSVPVGTPGSYRATTRDDPAANEFRVLTRVHGSFGTRNSPIGDNREKAEHIVHMLNSAFAAGLERPEGILVGRMGHYNRDEENMP